ncbi:MAG TPA: hypothetical protein VN515_01585 [Terriglobales bacterium]|nr:hypothetical protein [Terriglobales bacterium]
MRVDYTQFRNRPKIKIMGAEQQPVSWVDQILAAMDSGADPTLIAAQLKLTPTERIERMQAYCDAVAELRNHARRLP